MNLRQLNQTDHCLHFSCPKRSVSPVVYISLYVCGAAVVLLTILGNLITIISVVYFKQLHTPTNTLVLSLAVSDFLIGALVMSPTLIWMIESCWIFDKGYCICILIISCVLICLSIYNVALISVDRYLALSNPFLYTNTISCRIVYIVVFFTWCTSLVYNIALCYFRGRFSVSVMCPGECYLILDEVWSLIDLVIIFIFPLSVIIIFYSQVFIIAKKHVTAIREFNNHMQTKIQKISSQSKSERKAAKVLGILVFVFLVCLLPYFIYTLLGNAIKQQTEIFLVVFFVLCINSTINPIIYALFYPWFRKCFTIIITLKIFQTDSQLINVLS